MGFVGTLRPTSVAELFQDIPAEYREPGLNIPPPLSEMELLREMERLSQRNFHAGAHPAFLGAGVYNHYCPAVVAPDDYMGASVHIISAVWSNQMRIP